MRGDVWTQVPDQEKFGIVIFSFLHDKPHWLSLFYGDPVHILLEHGEWYYGYCTRKRAVRGIFPKSYVHIKDAIVEKNGADDVLFAKELGIAQEISVVLREWGTIAKQYYVTRNSGFEKIKERIYELVDIRKRLLSGTLPIDEAKEIRQKAISVIDIGNWQCNLDLVVRDDNGNILNPDWTGTVNLYRQHVLAAARIKKSHQGENRNSSLSSVSHNLYLAIKNFVCKVADDPQLIMTLYDANEGTFISEHYVVKWSKTTLDLDRLSNMKVIFTDLGSKDLEREKVFLVCQIVRTGPMELKDSEHTKKAKKVDEALRRPLGVAVLDVSRVLSGKLDDEERHHFVPFVQCSEREFLDTLTKKLTAVKEVSHKEHKGQGVWVTLKMLHGDLKQVREAYPHLVSITTHIARKMGFPEIILPGDIRNDLYLTIASGEFSKGAKTSDKNVEVTVRACDENGNTIANVITIGAGVDTVNEYHSVVYYHEDKPKWYETIKIAIPIEMFYSAHLLFQFKHRSSSENKDKSERPFAISFVKLMQPNGTTLKDEEHDLLVYKVDKKFDPKDGLYLNLPSKKGNDVTRRSISDAQTKACSKDFTLSNKDTFQISSLVCSTKLTQNVDLLGLLKWRDNPNNLENSLKALMKVDGEEVVKFLQDTLDALFNILMESNNLSENYDRLVFDALVFIVSLIADRKYLHFRPVLDTYVEHNFCATLAYKKLIPVLMTYVDTADDPGQECLLKTLKCLQYLIKFIVRSRMLYAQVNEGDDEQEFILLFKQLLKSIGVMMSLNNDITLTAQAACLKYLPNAISDVVQVFDPVEFSSLLVTFLNSVPDDRLVKQKLMSINEIVQSSLFDIPACRAILLPQIIEKHVRPELKLRVEIPGKSSEFKSELELSVEILSDILEILHKQRVGTIGEDITILMSLVFRTVVKMVIGMDRSVPLVGNLVAIMISMLRQMEATHYEKYINCFNSSKDLLDFLIEILMVFTDLVSKTVFPKDWNEMIMLQNSVILKALRHFSHTIRDVFSSPFEKQVWNNFFHAAICFLTQDALQLDNFTENKRKKIMSRYHDMRRETGRQIRAMWFNLGQNKIHFVPSMVGRFLEMTLIPEKELRQDTISIFFDMMQCEFYSSRDIFSSSGEYQGHQGSKENIKGNFQEFEKEMITQLDALIPGGRGDKEYGSLFSEIMSELCSKHSILREAGNEFVKTVTELLGYLLEYRDIVQEESMESRLSCTVSIMEFYSRIARKDMYIRYLNKLCDLHVELQNYTEAAFALKLHAHLLKWSDEELPLILTNEKYQNCKTHRALKESLYNDICAYFDKGKMWEASLELCKELTFQYENEIYDYHRLSELLQKMASFYDKIVKELRPEPEYFRVAFYGKGFPSFFQNKVFIFRGKEYEKLDEFSGRLQNSYPKAQVMTKLVPPDDDVLNSNQQYLQINKVDPVMENRMKKKFHGKSVHPKILSYYKVNDVQTFTYSRPIRKGNKDSSNEFSNLWVERTTMKTSCPLPSILRWFPVKSCTINEMSPLENAIETMEGTNKKISNSIAAHKADPTLPVNPLGMLLNGIVDAAVMGGISNYEKAFFNDRYLIENSSDDIKVQKLKDLIADQIPLLEVGIAIHKVKIPDSLKPFHDKITFCFTEMKKSVEEKYGKRASHLSNIEVASPLRLNRPSVIESHISTKSLPDINNIGHDISQQTFPQKLSPALRVQSVFMKPIQSPTKTLKKNKDSNAVLRRSSGNILGWPSDTLSQSQSQWYDIKETSQPVIELNQQLKAERPRRSEMEKRHSRPSSGHYRGMNSENSSPLATPVGSASSQSLNSVEDDVPPPLPQKQSTSIDCSTLTQDNANNTLTRMSINPVLKLISKPSTATIKEKTPPPVPKKPSRKISLFSTNSNNSKPTDGESEC